jgi:signal transduction histidine kinase
VDVLVSAVDDRVVLRVADDGKGMEGDVLESGLGNMRQRAHKHGGSFDVQSASGAGTTVTWSVPAR